MIQNLAHRLSKQTCIVTGANSGIGKAVALAMGKESANVVVNYISDAAAAEEVAHEIEMHEAKAIIFRADVSKEDQVESMFKATVEHFGTVDILVANAGLQRDARLHEMSLAHRQTVIDVNLTGQFLCAREAIRIFLRQGRRPDVSSALGKIIHMSSVHEVIPWAGHANYAASKGAIVMLMKSIAQEYAPYGIRANSIAPGAIQTPINRDAWENKEALDDLLKLIPYKRMGQPSDIGAATVWLASDESDYIKRRNHFCRWRNDLLSRVYNEWLVQHFLRTLYLRNAA